jgi:hypothetical protein
MSILDGVRFVFGLFNVQVDWRSTAVKRTIKGISKLTARTVDRGAIVANSWC